MIRNRKALKKASKKGFSTSPKSIHSTNDSTWKHMVSPLILTFARPDFEQVLQHDQERALNPITTTLCKGRSAVDDKWCWQNLSHWEGVENRIDTGEREYVQAMVFPRIWYPRRSLPSLSTFVHYDIGISSIKRIISKLNLWTYLSILNTTSRKHILFEQIATKNLKEKWCCVSALTFLNSFTLYQQPNWFCFAFCCRPSSK